MKAKMKLRHAAAAASSAKKRKKPSGDNVELDEGLVDSLRARNDYAQEQDEDL
jgi:hypothetical protein